MDLTLSMGLFSSKDIDRGTRLLLKTLAQKKYLNETESLLDIGCGAGTIGLACAGAYPNLKVVMNDRDALALEATRYNAHKNKIKNIEVMPGLFFDGIKESFDLIVSNLPAKAGAPVLKEFFASVSHYLNPNGKGAVVIVDPLADEAENWIRSHHLKIIFKESTSQYTVFHFQKASEVKSFDPSCFLREQTRIPCPEIEIELETVYNIPSFDTLSYRDQNSLVLLSEIALSENPEQISYLNPEQGLLPLWLNAMHPGSTPHLCSRDLLSLWISRRNLDQKTSDRTGIDSHSLYFPEDFPSALLTIANIQPIPQCRWIPIFQTSCEKTVSSGSYLLLASKSNTIHLLTKNWQGWESIGDIRSYGYRSLLLRKK